MDDDIFWTPLKAAVWIATRGVEPEFSIALSDWRWVWKDSGPGPRDEKIFGHAFGYRANEQNSWPSRPDTKNDPGDSKAIPEIELLKEKLSSDHLVATGLPKGKEARVSIPALEWIDLHFMGEKADTALSPAGLAYISVRLRRDDILRLWPTAAATSGDEQPREQSPSPRPKGRKKETKVDAVAGRFNGHLFDKVLVVLEEAFFAGDPAAVAATKALVTNTTLGYEAKGKDAFSAPNYAHVISLTNNDWAVPAGADSRRWMVLDVSEARKGNHHYFTDLAHEMEHGGTEAFLHHLLNINLGGWNSRVLPESDALHAQQRETLMRNDPVAGW